jgi:hypothetical protein
VSQCKFIFQEKTSRKIFGEFMEIFLKGLNHVKIQTKFKLDLIPRFYFKIHLEYELPSKRKVVSFAFIYPLTKFAKFWKSGSTSLIF